MKPVVWTGEVADVPFAHPLINRVRKFTGRVVALDTDEVDVSGQLVSRDVVRHPGAAAVVAINDAGQVLLVRQYRHPVQHLLWEIPAGLLDVAGEDPLECARRELLEEGGATAREFEPLLTLYVTPGGSDEVIYVFLARGIEMSATGRVMTGEAEEQDMPQVWLALEQAIEAVMQGRIRNNITVAALLAAAQKRDRKRSEGP